MIESCCPIKDKGSFISYWLRYRSSFNTILDSDGERVDGTFYEPELQPVTIDPSTEYQVEKILKRRVHSKGKEVLVRWLHWPKKYDNLIPEADVKDYY